MKKKFSRHFGYFLEHIIPGPTTIHYQNTFMSRISNKLLSKIVKIIKK